MYHFFQKLFNELAGTLFLIFAIVGFLQVEAKLPIIIYGWTEPDLMIWTIVGVGVFMGAYGLLLGKIR